MPPMVCRVIEVRASVVMDLPIRTNLGLAQGLQAILSGRLLASLGVPQSLRAG